ncbi:MAG: mechanosensitive ion channel domain-containing protein, partial [Bacteroidota bacterium]
QQTFNDLVSGLILLVEGSVEVGDIIQVDGLIGKVESINIRTSQIGTRDNVSILVPNSKLVGENAINWSHTATPARFQIRVGVSYSSNVDLVTNLLLQAANDHPKVLKNPAPHVQFIDFGSSSLDFDLHFFSREYMTIEMVKSDIRYTITRLFRDNHIEIPFPQRDLWLRNGEVLHRKS